MSLAEFESLMGGIASAVTAAALIIGAIWALFTFHSLLEIPRRRAELQATEAQIRNSELEAMLAQAEIRKSDAELRQLELQNHTQAVVDITIEAKQASLPGDDARYIGATVLVKNTGSRNTRLLFQDEKPFSVRSVTFDGDGEPQYGEPQHYAVARAAMPTVSASSLVLRTGSTETIPFFCRIPDAGLYYLAFSTPLTEDDSEVALQVGAVRRTRWVARTFFVAT